MKLLANWRTTLLGFLYAIVTVLTVMATIPYDSGMQVIGTVFGAEVRDGVMKWGLVAWFLLQILKSVVSADAKTVQSLKEKLNEVPNEPPNTAPKP